MLNVLIVEDDPPLRALYSRFLDYMGYGTIQVCTCFEALEQLERSVPDALVVDLSIPRGNGWWLVRTLWRQERFHDAQIVALIDANIDPADIQHYSIEHCLTKPVPAPKLIALLFRLTAERNAAEQHESGLARSAYRSK
jgi:CheY-like chemotaxis protein